MIKYLFYAIYIALLGVLLPHTAWAFSRFQEVEGWYGQKNTILAWALAVVFELTIFAITYHLKGLIEKSSRMNKKADELRIAFGWRRFSSAYVNVFGLLLLLASGVSALANFSYAVEFGQSFLAFDRYELSPTIYELAFGGILPIVSLIFARILADTAEAEADRTDGEREAKKGERLAKKDSARLRVERDKLRIALKHFEALSAQAAKDRIIAARALWPVESQAKIAGRAGVSASTVSEVLKNNGKGVER